MPKTNKSHTIILKEWIDGKGRKRTTKAIYKERVIKFKVCLK